MKKIVVILSMIALLSACGDSEKDEKKEEINVEINADMQFADLIKMDQELVNSDLSINLKVAEKLFTAAKNFSAKYPEHPKAIDALEMAAKTAESLGEYNDAINILHSMANDFEETELTPRYLYNKARILEERMGKKENAKKAYQELIKRFPNDPLSISAQQYLDYNYMDMSDEELIKMLEEKNKVAE